MKLLNVWVVVVVDVVVLRIQGEIIIVGELEKKNSAGENTGRVPEMRASGPLYLPSLIA